ncbi:sensor histidine kinase [Streptomyces sp. H10-C2]|uniref:sensor histidine kinase n=1 Tax=unclassified Streptomyces TaxID=2593676 RepID=UPI0024B93B21|nr:MULTISPECIES: sensor histidine kinase [unclassified Streptomyces]MDJ0343447.1 sensor histidine kinase [Streptomyces sp. PH10-H1]MDJ0371527.1 sensor histidine kinase [Streptomyces sp. H10-C2]
MINEGGGRQVVSALSAASRALRDDLWSAAADPLPRMGGPRWLARLPHVLIVVFALFVVKFADNYPLDKTSSAFAVILSLALVVAMFRPMLAWWVSVISMVVAVQGTELARTPFPGIGPGIDAGTTLPWSTPGAALQAGVLFLLALRVRPRVTAETLAISLLTGLACISFSFRGHNDNAARVLVVFVIAAVLGAALRGRRVARTQLVVQEELNAEERARRTLLEERNRIARELHDVVAHHMSVISIQAQVAPHLVENPSDELKANLVGIRQNAVEALTELRRVLGVLRSEDALPDGVRHAPQPGLDRLDELVGNVRGAGLTVTTGTTGPPYRLSPGVELSAFRIVQEALSNAMRHAPGAEVRVEIGYQPFWVMVRVTNSQPARPAPPSQGSGHGLLGMRERTAMLGGELSTGATPEGGYEVTALLPTHPFADPADPADPAEYVEDTP